MALSFSGHAQEIRLVPQQHPTIQSAVDASSSGDTILVAPGIYYETIDISGKSVTLKSVGGPAGTIINGLRKGTVVSITVDTKHTTTLSGFTLTQGFNLQGPGGLHVGGNVTLAGRAIITGNFIVDNFGRCSAVRIDQTASIVHRNVIARNRSIPGVFGGGGVGIDIAANPCPDYSCGAQIIGNTIEDNVGKDCLLGGGIYAGAAGSVRIVGNVIRRNVVEAYGGGIAMGNDTRAHIENNLIAENVAGSSGGGIYWTTPNFGMQPVIVNNTFANNHAPEGSALHIQGLGVTGRLQNNVIVDLVGHGSLMQCGSPSDQPNIPSAQNNNFHSELGSLFSQNCGELGNGSGEISQAPTFLSLSDYRLSPLSAGIDAGDNAFSSQSVDLQSVDRIVDGNGDGLEVIDMGAYEYGDALFGSGFELDLPQ